MLVRAIQVFYQGIEKVREITGERRVGGTTDGDERGLKDERIEDRHPDGRTNDEDDVEPTKDDDNVESKGDAEEETPAKARELTDEELAKRHVFRHTRCREVELTMNCTMFTVVSNCSRSNCLYLATRSLQSMFPDEWGRTNVLSGLETEGPNISSAQVSSARRRRDSNRVQLHTSGPLRARQAYGSHDVDAQDISE